MGPPRGAARADGRPASAAGGVPRDPAPARARGRGTGAAAARVPLDRRMAPAGTTTPSMAARPPRSTRWSRSRKRAWPSGSSTTTMSVGAVSSGSCRWTRPRRAGAPAAVASSATSSTAHSGSSELDDAVAVLSRDGIVTIDGAGFPVHAKTEYSPQRRPPRPDARAARDPREPRRRLDRRPRRRRVRDHDARRRRQPGGLVGGRRRARRATTGRAQRGHRPDRPGQRLARRRG